MELNSLLPENRNSGSVLETEIDSYFSFLTGQGPSIWEKQEVNFVRKHNSDLKTIITKKEKPVSEQRKKPQEANKTNIDWNRNIVVLFLISYGDGDKIFLVTFDINTTLILLVFVKLQRISFPGIHL